MERSFLASTFQPHAAATRATGRYAPWVLLDSRSCFFAVHENATTAEAVTSTGRTIKVTFCLAYPPAISHFCVHGPAFQRGDFMPEPLVLFSAKDLVLLRFSFTVGPRSTRRDCGLAEYFVYKAGRGKPPSLTPIPHAHPGTRNSNHICILPFDDHDGGFLLADLFMTKHRSDYQLHVFSSKTARWTTTPLELRTSPGAGVREEDMPSPFLNKVITLGGGVVGWVDLCRGIVSCDVFDENPLLSFIPIPTLGECDEKGRTRAPRPVRDVTCRNGYIKFVDLDLRVRGGWELRTCYRHISWDYWHKGHTVDIDDISAHNLDSVTGLPLWLWCQLTPTLWDAQAGRWALGNMITAFPTLGIDDDDVVYIMSKANFLDTNAWMLAVDLAKKTVDALVQVSSERLRFFNPKFLTCEFSEYLNNAIPRSSTDLVNPAPNGAQKYHLSSSDSVSKRNLPPQQWNNSYCNGSCYGHTDTAHDDHPPPPCFTNLPQPLHPSLTSRGSECVYPVNAQSTDQVSMVNKEGEQRLSPTLGATGPPCPSAPSHPCGSTGLYRLFY